MAVALFDSGLHDDSAVAVGLKDTFASGAELPRWFYRLPAHAQRTYLKSDSIDRIELTPGDAAFARIDGLMRALDFGAPSAVERASQAVVEEVCRLLAIRALAVEVRGVRPHNTRGELHGIFYPRGPANRPGAPLIILWMRTAQRHDVVKPKTFVRTLMHELAHYLDYVLLGLDDSFHTTGFFRRESFLVRSLYRTPAA
jgi:hypothetical protein